MYLVYMYLDEFWVFWRIFSGILVFHYLPWPTLISRETLFLTDIYIINLFVLMSFDNYTCLDL